MERRAASRKKDCCASMPQHPYDSTARGMHTHPRSTFHCNGLVGLTEEICKHIAQHVMTYDNLFIIIIIIIGEKQGTCRIRNTVILVLLFVMHMCIMSNLYYNKYILKRKVHACMFKFLFTMSHGNHCTGMLPLQCDGQSLVQLVDDAWSVRPDILSTRVAKTGLLSNPHPPNVSSAMGMNVLPVKGLTFVYLLFDNNNIYMYNDDYTIITH